MGIFDKLRGDSIRIHILIKGRIGDTWRDVDEYVRLPKGTTLGRLVEVAGREYMVRGRGYVKSVSDLEKLVLKAGEGTPVQVKDVATVALGPEMRRGIADYNGEGDVVGVLAETERAPDDVEQDLGFGAGQLGQQHVHQVIGEEGVVGGGEAEELAPRPVPGLGRLLGPPPRHLHPATPRGPGAARPRRRPGPRSSRKPLVPGGAVC